jgi:polyisoprenoid-binding protein YceI
MQTWTADTSHGSIDFKVRHMGISWVRGRFARFQATGVTDGRRLERVSATIETSSLTTGDERRDGHLHSADFFAADEHPELRFESTGVTPLGDGRYRVTGDLTMRGRARPITFEAKVEDALQDPFGLTRTAVHVVGKLNRTDWGLEWNQVLEVGGLLVGEEVHFDFDVEFVLEQDLQPA